MLLLSRLLQSLPFKSSFMVSSSLELASQGILVLQESDSEGTELEDRDREEPRDDENVQTNASVLSRMAVCAFPVLVVVAAAVAIPLPPRSLSLSLDLSKKAMASSSTKVFLSSFPATANFVPAICSHLTSTAVPLLVNPR